MGQQIRTSFYLCRLQKCWQCATVASVPDWEFTGFDHHFVCASFKTVQFSELANDFGSILKSNEKLHFKTAQTNSCAKRSIWTWHGRNIFSSNDATLLSEKWKWDTYVRRFFCHFLFGWRGFQILNKQKLLLMWFPLNESWGVYFVNYKYFVNNYIINSHFKFITIK